MDKVFGSFDSTQVRFYQVRLFMYFSDNPVVVSSSSPRAPRLARWGIVVTLKERESRKAYAIHTIGTKVPILPYSWYSVLLRAAWQLLRLRTTYPLPYYCLCGQLTTTGLRTTSLRTTY